MRRVKVPVLGLSIHQAEALMYRTPPNPNPTTPPTAFRPLPTLKPSSTVKRRLAPRCELPPLKCRVRSARRTAACSSVGVLAVVGRLLVVVGCCVPLGGSSLRPPLRRLRGWISCWVCRNGDHDDALAPDARGYCATHGFAGVARSRCAALRWQHRGGHAHAAHALLNVLLLLVDMNSPVAHAGSCLSMNLCSISFQ